MTYLLATFVYPLLLLALAGGVGLLVDRAAGSRLPGLLIPPFGMAGLIVVGELLTYSATTATVLPAALVVLAVLGLVLGRGRLRGRPDGWALAVGVAAYLIAIAPVLLAGRATVAGYLLDTTVGIHLAGAEALADHGRDFAGLPDSGWRIYMDRYIGIGYPTGGYALLLGTGRLSGVDLVWVYQPLLAALLGMCAPVLLFLLRRAGMPALVAVPGAVLASVPALVLAYAFQGAIKEITALLCVLLVGAAVAVFGELREGAWRAGVPLAVAGAAGLASIGLAFGAWLGAGAAICFAVLLADLRRGRTEPAAVAKLAGVFAALVAVLAATTLLSLSSALRVTTTLSASQDQTVNDPGNLLQPLKAVQMLGVWITGHHRVEPGEYIQETYLLIGLVTFAALLGVVYLVRSRRWWILAFTVATALVWAVLTVRGKVWTDAKLLTITSPMAVALAVIGVGGLVKLGRRLEGAVLGVALAAGVLASSALLYHETTLLPTDRFEELVEIGERYAGQGPTLAPDFDEFALYALRDTRPDSPGLAFRSPRLATLRGGALPGYGRSYDLDALGVSALEAFPLIVMRRGPEYSRPPAGYRRVFAGRFYDVWRRESTERLLAHVPSGQPLSPDARPACGAVRTAARLALGAGGRLVASLRAPTARIDPLRARRSYNFPEVQGGVGLVGQGEVLARFRVPEAGRYRIWLKGDFSRAVEVSVDGEPVGSVAYQAGGDGNYAEPLAVELTAGRHSMRLLRGGGGLRPGDAAGSRLTGVVIESTRPARLVTRSPDDWRALCRQRVDWVEAVV